MMELLEQIIKGVTDVKEPVADTLRRCLILAFKLKNETLKVWVEKELNGYLASDSLPDYRKCSALAKGIMLGSFQQQINDQPIPAALLEPEHRHWADEASLRQPIASYDALPKEAGSLRIPWPGDLVLHYQSKIIEGMALNRAWIEIPNSILPGLLDTVRTRILTFALEIQSQLPTNNEAEITKLPMSTVERLVQVTILGGTNVVGTVNTFDARTVIAGDIESLKTALTAFGVDAADVHALETDLPKRNDRISNPSADEDVKPKIYNWIRETAKKLGERTLNVGAEVAEEGLKRIVFSYLGLSP